MYFSPHQKQAYIFGGLNLMDVGQDTNWHVWKPFGGHWHCEPSQKFVQQVILNWSKDEAKVGRLLTENCTWFRAFESDVSLVEDVGPELLS
jgi:hypothetical protein